MKKKIVVFVLIFIIVFLFFYFYLKSKQNEKKVEITTKTPVENTYTSNIIENVEYLSRDAKGNEYIIRAKEGEIDINNDNIIFLKNVSAIIKLNNSKNILIYGD